MEALESGFALKGNFVVGKTYQVTLAAGTRGLLGGVLDDAFSQAVSFAAERPGLSFASGDKAMYLDALGNRNLGLRINQVQKVKVTIAKVYANNIQQLLRGEPDYGYPDYDEDEPPRSQHRRKRRLHRPQLPVLRHRKHRQRALGAHHFGERACPRKTACACSTST